MQHVECQEWFTELDVHTCAHVCTMLVRSAKICTMENELVTLVAICSESNTSKYGANPHTGDDAGHPKHMQPAHQLRRC